MSAPDDALSNVKKGSQYFKRALRYRSRRPPPWLGQRQPRATTDGKRIPPPPPDQRGPFYLHRNPARSFSS